MWQLIKSFFCWVGAHDLKPLGCYVGVDLSDSAVRPHYIKKCAHCEVTYENTRYGTWRKCLMNRKFRWKR